ncbi:MAG TPA: stage II sporulation protein R [Clostridiaceae bacterium]|nr:stage II sporulation protein R [Clostridiaceae bacterium]
MSRVLLFIKEFGNNQKVNTAFKITVLLVLTAAVTITAISAIYSDRINKGLADNLVRLHVVANSDSEEDQALKIEVRDAVIDYMKIQLKDSKNLEETKYIINNNINKIEKIALDKVKSYGKNYPVKVSLGNYPFPTKSYGDVRLPSGEYQALRIVIGEGIGTNWWCVLFPPLCFVDATHGTIPESVKDDLKKVLTEEEYKIITSTDNEGDIPVKIKFKIVEFFQDSSIKFAGFINKILGKGK